MGESETDDQLIGSAIGRFRLVRKVGEGGMGSVYQAERMADFEQTVALKLLLERAHDPETVARFRAEQQALAVLNHPNIVQLIDGGVSRDGIPYLAMDYVDGEPLDEFCDRRQLPIPDRIRLFLQVLAAVEFAHQRFLVHCDLKFSNILVTSGGEPKLLDFGITKLLEPQHYGLSGAQTQFASLRPYTPQFGSPEQLQNKPLTTASDIYSAGVLLYVLTTGRHPFEPLIDQPMALIYAVTATPPEAPGRCFAQLRRDDPELARQIATARGARPEALEKTVAGDLDAIILKALRKEPDGRYLSAAQFAGDLRRYLEGRPVEAQHRSHTYRAVRFIQRNRGMAVSAVLLAAIVMAGTGATLWQGYRAQRSRARAQERFEDVRKMTGALLFDFQDAVSKLPGSVNAQQSLMNWSVEYLDNLARQSPENASLRIELAQGYLRLGNLLGNPYENNLGKPDEARVTIDKGLRTIEPLLRNGANDRDTLLTVARLRGARSQVQFMNGAGGESLSDAQEAVRLLRSLAGRFPKDYEILTEVASHCETLGDLMGGSGLASLMNRQGALETFRESLRWWKEAGAADSSQIRPLRAQSVLNMKMADVIAESDPVASLAYYEAAVGWYDSLPEAKRNDLSTRRLMGSARRRFGATLMELSEYEKAIEQFQKGLELSDSLARLDPTDQRAQWDLAVLLMNYVNAESEIGRKSEALARSQRLTGILERITKEGAPLMIQKAYGESLVSRGVLENELGQTAQARQSTARGLAILKDNLNSADLSPSELQRAAWGLLMAQPPDMADPGLALVVLLRLTGGGSSANPDSLALLAEAQQRSHLNQDAHDTAQRALALLPPARPGEKVPQIRARLERIFRETEAPPVTQPVQPELATPRR